MLVLVLCTVTSRLLSICCLFTQRVICLTSCHYLLCCFSLFSLVAHCHVLCERVRDGIMVLGAGVNLAVNAELHYVIGNSSVLLLFFEGIRDSCFTADSFVLFTSI